MFVPINPLLKAEQVGYILRNCDVRVLVTSRDRWTDLKTGLGNDHPIEHVILVDAIESSGREVSWMDLVAADAGAPNLIRPF